MRLIPLLIAVSMVTGLQAASAEDAAWKSTWDGMLYGYGTNTNLQNDSVLNPGNYLAKLNQHSDTAEGRFDFNADSNALQIFARPILLTQHDGNSFGETSHSESYLSQWKVRWKSSDSVALSGGRELLNWGPAQFRSPSNPYYFNNGRSNPMAELSGIDTMRLSYAPNVNTAVYLARIYDSGYGHSNPDPWSNSWLVKADWRGEDSVIGMALARQAQQSLFIGAHGQRTIEDAWLLYGEVGSYTLPNLLRSPADANQPFNVETETARRTDVLAGASYTFENGHTFYAEYMRYDHGFTAAESSAYFARAASGSNEFPSANSIPVLATALTNAPPLLGRDYLYFVWQSNMMESSGFSRVMLTHNLTDNSDELSGYSEYTVSSHLSIFGLATFNYGGVEREFARLFDQMITAGVKVALP